MSALDKFIENIDSGEVINSQLDAISLAGCSLDMSPKSNWV